MTIPASSKVTLQFGASLADGTSVIIYNSNMFIIQATGVDLLNLFSSQWTVIRKRLVPNHHGQTH